MNLAEKTASIAFPSTRWTLIRRAQGGTGKDAAQAMEEVCRQYWFPIYAFARHSGFSAQDAEDLTQTFFQRLVASETVQAAREEKGRLRSFMLAMLKKIISNHLRTQNAEKRGGSASATVSFEELDAEGRYTQSLADSRDPDSLFDRAWAHGVLASATEKLRQDFEKADNLVSFEQLREFLPLGDNATPYADAAKRLGINEATLRLQIHRMRKRYGKLIEEAVAETVGSRGEVKAELGHLMAVVGGGAWVTTPVT